MFPLFKYHSSEILRSVVVRLFGIYIIPREIMLVRGLVAAFVEVRSQRSREFCVGAECVHKRERHFVKNFPAVVCPARLYVEECFCVVAVERRAVVPAMPEADVQTAVGVYLKVEVPVLTLRHEEEFKTAVLIHRRQRLGVLRADILLGRVQMNIQIFVVIAELSLCPDSAVRLPQYIVEVKLRNS